MNLIMEWELLPPMFRVIHQNCAQSYVRTVAAPETGVERKADVVFLQNPPTERAGIGISHSVYDIRERKLVWMAVHRGSGLTMNERTDFSNNADDNIIVVDIKRRGKKMIRIINIYIQRTREI